MPALGVAVRPDGTFTTTTVIPRSRAAGSYPITGRCGGGNFGGTTLQVRAAPTTPTTPPGPMAPTPPDPPVTQPQPPAPMVAGPATQPTSQLGEPLDHPRARGPGQQHPGRSGCVAVVPAPAPGPPERPRTLSPGALTDSTPIGPADRRANGVGGWPCLPGRFSLVLLPLGRPPLATATATTTQRSSRPEPGTSSLHRTRTHPVSGRGCCRDPRVRSGAQRRARSVPSRWSWACPHSSALRGFGVARRRLKADGDRGTAPVAATVNLQ
jgi:hypothetical protein